MSFDTSSSLHTPPEPAEYLNLGDSSAPQQPRRLRRTASAFVDCHRVLTETFGKTDYKGKQKEIVENAVLGADILVVAPTGMGKSLCFQIPALADQHGVTIVVSPLLALMKNQVSKLRECDVPVASFSSETDSLEKAEITKDLSSGHPRTRLLYITPEKLCTYEFIALLAIVHRQGELNRLVIDEAHCISEWGHDFRSEYRRLGFFRERFPDVSIMALTASATPAVQDDIVQSLKMSKDFFYKVVHPFNRSNLFYEIRYLANPEPTAQMTSIHEYITALHRRRGCPSSGIIYCRARVTCNELSDFLRRKGLNARPYHRGLPAATLDKTMQQWEQAENGIGGVDIVCATIAFGMGIDKPDVRYIIHYDLPKSFEGYYQETGRAGRDGSAAKCVLYYSREDVLRVRKLVKSSHGRRVNRSVEENGPQPSQRSVDSLTALVNFAETTEICRHVSICRYFGEEIDEKDAEILKTYCSGMCDVCKYPEKTRQRKSQLSSDHFISTQAARLESENVDDDDDYPVPRLPPLPRGANRNAPLAVNPDPVAGPSRLGKAVYPAPKRALEDRADPVAGPAKKQRTLPLQSRVAPRGLASAPGLAKPFRVPSKQTAPPRSEWEMPVDRMIVDRVLQPVTNLPEPEELNEPEDSDCVRPSSPIMLSEDEMDVDISFSQKIPLGDRQAFLHSIRKTLQKIFVRDAHTHSLWTELRVPRDDARRARILAATAKEIEVMVWGHCATATGYGQGAALTARSLKALRDPAAWGADGDSSAAVSDDVDGTRDIVRVMRRVADASAAIPSG